MIPYWNPRVFEMTALDALMILSVMLERVFVRDIHIFHVWAEKRVGKKILLHQFADPQAWSILSSSITEEEKVEAVRKVGAIVSEWHRGM